MRNKLNLDYLDYETLTADLDSKELDKMNHKEKSYAIIKNGILNNLFPQDTPIAQARLAELCHVSRTPLREAIRRLEQESMLISEKNKRLIIPSLSAKEVDEIVATRILIQAVAVEQSFPNLIEENLANLQKYYEEMVAGSRENRLSDVHRAHSQFHIEICMYANKYLRYQMKCLSELSQRYKTPYLQHFPLDIESHRIMLESCKQKNLDLLVHTMNLHTARMGLMSLTVIDSMYESVEIRRVLRFLHCDNNVPT